MSRKPDHHPDDDLLFSYASGALFEVKALFVATHLAFCPSCRARVSAYEESCGEWLAGPEPEPEPAADCSGMDALLAELMSRLDEPEGGHVLTAKLKITEPAVEERAHWVPEPLRSYRGFTDVDWEEIAPGVAFSTWAYEASGSRVCLLRMAPGSAVPAHRHTAIEGLMPLVGTCRDEYGAYERGDALIYPAGSLHHAEGTGTEDCICLYLLDGELEFLDGQERHGIEDCRGRMPD